MAKDYKELASFMRAHKSDPLALAKIMTSWAWASLLPGGGAGAEPVNAKNVVKVMSASCGWRDILMDSLFEGIGIQHRRVNFYDVPFQTNHTATELFINGKWMFFDSTYGVYLTRKGSSVPLSMEEARTLWPDVVIQQSNLKGWQGTFVDPKQINAKSYSPAQDTFGYAPKSYYQADGVITGEFYSLYFGNRATYMDGHNETAIGGGDRSWNIVRDTSGTKSWSKSTTFIDLQGRLDAQHVVMDDKSQIFTHWDLDNNYSWSVKKTIIAENSRIQSAHTTYDDGSKLALYYDVKLLDVWDSVLDHYSVNGKQDYKIITYDDGKRLEIDFDASQLYSWSKYEDWYDSAGQVISTTITFDDGHVKFFDWSVARKIVVTAGSNSVVGTSGDDALFGSSGDDFLDGGAGMDRMEGGAGNDTYYVDDTNDIVIEKENGGNDTVVASTDYALPRNVENLVLTGDAIYGTGQELDNWVVGNARNNVLSGGAGNDRLVGMDGDDLLSGGTGRDTLEGGLGADTLYGGPDADVFLWRSLAEIGTTLKSSDFVKDFSREQGDVLNFRLIDADETRAGNQNFTFIGDQAFSAPGQIRYAFSGKDTILYFNVDNDPSAEAVLRIAGKQVPDASWFVL
ncbi:calcium-binding protein [Microvirga alba]|uniref:Calcium-binding protein n=1 Tax=Microvirga alba TaxID=2791025 RepID=A0A931BIU4_9HYPH|nr:calcium-binding protein [Microvirga alba]MBF9231991.1 calcium-binding protein [Microvirga alba]